VTREARSVEVYSTQARSTDWRPWLLILSALVIVLDRLSKVWVSNHLEIGDAIPIIPHVFRISHVLNSGAAFSLFTDSSSPARVRLMLVSFSILAAIAVIVFLIKLGRQLSPTTVALALVLGGAIGNVYDRIRYGTVIDFLEVHIINYHWPDFNVADSAIVVGALLLLWGSIRNQERKSEP
jgi:signal peptidase II